MVRRLSMVRGVGSLFFMVDYVSFVVWVWGGLISD
jgi:hypothetical protein